MERGYNRDPWGDQWSAESASRLEIQSLTSQKGEISRQQGSKQTEDDGFPHNVAKS